MRATCSGRSATPRAKEIIDEASPITPPQAHSYIDTLLTVYWFATDQPEAATQASKRLALDDLPPMVGAEIAWALTAIAADAGRTTDAVAVAEAGYSVATRSFDAPHMRFNIADAHVSALLLSGRVWEAVEVAERVRRQAADLPGAAQLLGAVVAGRATLGAGDLDATCALLEQAAEGLSATHAIGWGYRYRVPLTTALAMRGSSLEAATAVSALDKARRPFRSLDFERSLARAWTLEITGSGGIVDDAIVDILPPFRRWPSHTGLAAFSRENEMQPLIPARSETGELGGLVLSIIAKWWIAPNYGRLCEIKQVVDPDGIFAFQQGIGSPFRPQTAEPLDLSPLNRSQFP